MKGTTAKKIADKMNEKRNLQKRQLISTHEAIIEMVEYLKALKDFDLISESERKMMNDFYVGYFLEVDAELPVRV